MPDLGERGNVMGPQPIAPIATPPPAMLAAAERFVTALMAGDRAGALAMTDAQAADAVGAIADSIAPGRYDRFEFFGRARIAKHHFMKARLHGSGATRTLQFRLGPRDHGAFTVREVSDLSNVRSAWTK